MSEIRPASWLELQEAQYAAGDMGSWRPFVVDPRTGSARPLQLRTDGGSRSFGNPTATPADPAWPLQHPVWASVFWCMLLIAVTVPLTVRKFKQKTTD